MRVCLSLCSLLGLALLRSLYAQLPTPTRAPTSAVPTYKPSAMPSFPPSRSPTYGPSRWPSRTPVIAPTVMPTVAPPTLRPTRAPLEQPTSYPTVTLHPSPVPSSRPTSLPSARPSFSPSRQPSAQPSSQPSTQPSAAPSSPSSRPTSEPSMRTKAPTPVPTRVSRIPTRYRSPTSQPSSAPSGQPSGEPTRQPTRQPTASPSTPTHQPTSLPSSQPTQQPIVVPSAPPTAMPTSPTSQPTGQPTSVPLYRPTGYPTSGPTSTPTSEPTRRPVEKPSYSTKPTEVPSSQPTSMPTGQPTNRPSGPTTRPSSRPTDKPQKVTLSPSFMPTYVPTTASPTNTESPSYAPSLAPSAEPTTRAPLAPSRAPSRRPSRPPTARPTRTPTVQPTGQPSAQPVATPTGQPSGQPTSTPTQPTGQPSGQPSGEPSAQPSAQPTQPTGQPTGTPTGQPSGQPTGQPTNTYRPTSGPSSEPTGQPSSVPSSRPSATPTRFLAPTPRPTSRPTASPTSTPTQWDATLAPALGLTTFYGVTGNVKFFPDLPGVLCEPVEMRITVQFAENLTAGSTFRVYTSGITSGPCHQFMRGKNYNALYMPNTDKVTAQYFEGMPETNFEFSSILFTVKASVLDSELQHVFVIDRSNELHRACSYNASWTVEATQLGQKTGVVGYIERMETNVRECFFYSSLLAYTNSLNFFFTGFNMTFFPAFYTSPRTTFTLRLPGFSNKMGPYAMNPMTNTGVYNSPGNGARAAIRGLRWSTSFAWTATWEEGDASDHFAESHIVFTPSASGSFAQKMWLYVPQDENHIVLLCSHSTNETNIALEANSQYFDISPRKFDNPTLLGGGCDSLKGCNGHGRCDYCRSTCECEDGYGSAQDRKLAIVDDFASDCSSKACPTGPAIGALDSQFNSSVASERNTEAENAVQFPVDALNLHRYVECSNNGLCDRSRGVCLCAAGYEGAACDRMRCAGSPVCSGRGQCLPIQRLAWHTHAQPLSLQSVNYEDVNITSHSTWDARFGRTCVCDSSWAVGLRAGETQLAEFFGPACELRRCPSGDDPMTPFVDETDCEGVAQTPGGLDVGEAGNRCHVDCSNRGLCDYHTGVCRCFDGYSGSNCGIKV